MINVEIMHLCLHPQIIEKSVIDYSSPSLVQRGIFLYHQWYGGISLHAFSRTWVCVIVSGTAVHLFHRQWYVDELSPFISSVVRWYISLSYLQWNVCMCYRQWYGGISLFYIISGTVVYLFYTFSGTLVCVIVSGTAIYLFHRQWYVDESYLYHQWYGDISLSCLQWNVGMCY